MYVDKDTCTDRIESMMLCYLMLPDAMLCNAMLSPQPQTQASPARPSHPGRRIPSLRHYDICHTQAHKVCHRSPTSQAVQANRIRKQNKDKTPSARMQQENNQVGY